MRTALDIAVIVADIFAGSAAVFLVLALRDFIRIISGYTISTKEERHGETA